TDRDDVAYAFHIASNGGESSSILELNEHRDIWPDVKFVDTIQLYSKTLSSLLKGEKIDLSKYQALVLDTQGSELLVLLGSTEIIRYLRLILSDVADFVAFAGC